MTWQDVEALSKDVLVVIPTGSLEQHGPHLPLFTDSIIASSIADAVEKNLPNQVLLTPNLWLGASGHHLAFPGSLSADFATYMGAIKSIVESLSRHGFYRFAVLNGHGGNIDPIMVALRELKLAHNSFTLSHLSYFLHIEEAFKCLKGPDKTMSHACEAEVSLIMHLRPNLVRKDKLRNDGLLPKPPISGVIHHFDEISQEGSLGYGTFADPATGKTIFEAAVKVMTETCQALANGYCLEGT